MAEAVAVLHEQLEADQVARRRIGLELDQASRGEFIAEEKYRQHSQARKSAWMSERKSA